MSIPSGVTIADFKAQFFRDFQYLPVWDSLATYNTGDLVYYLVTNKFYTCLLNGVTSIPTTSGDWQLTTPQPNYYNYILDADITKAFAEAGTQFTSRNFSTPGDVKMYFLYLAAHYLVSDLSAGGLGSVGTGSGLLNSKSVGNVSVSYTIPEKYLSNVIFAGWAQTYYGRKYFQAIIPRLTAGGLMTVYSGTNA